MPPLLSAISPSSLDGPIVHELSSRQASPSAKAFQVICAWPVSGQYGPGTRFLYYVLVAACVLARKNPLLRKACLAAALLFPAVAAIHGIVLASVHVEGAVDMDIYGAFQLCSIGILTAPPTVRLSETYWTQVQGRNVVFLWTTLVLSGLLSLAVEFYRSSTVSCQGVNPRTAFVFGENASDLCQIRCSVNDGPFSPMRKGSANNIYVVPTPTKLTFGMGMLFSAACCVPAVLGLVSIWSKLYNTSKIKQKIIGRPSVQSEALQASVVVQSDPAMKRVNDAIKTMLSAVEIPVFSTAVLAILIIGELNFFSKPVGYQTEPIASIGQWAPIAGTVFAIAGSVLLLFTETSKEVSTQTDEVFVQEVQSPEIPKRPRLSNGARDAGIPKLSVDMHSIESAVIEEDHDTSELQRITGARIVGSPSNSSRGHSAERSAMSEGEEGREGSNIVNRAARSGDAGKGVVKKFLSKAVGSSIHERDTLSEFARAKRRLPEIPGESQRNPRLQQQQMTFSQHSQRRDTVDTEAGASPSHFDSHSRRGSSSSGELSALAMVTSRSPSPYPTPTSPRRAQAIGISHDRTHSDPPHQHHRTFSAASNSGVGLRRAETLTVPSQSHHR